MDYDFPYELGISSSQLTSCHIFQRGRAQPPTSSSMMIQSDEVIFFRGVGIPPISYSSMMLTGLFEHRGNNPFHREQFE